MNRFLYCVILLLFLTARTTSAQTEDIQFWSGVELEDKLVKKVKWSLESQVRFDDYLSSFKSFLLSPGLRFKVVKNVKLGLDYRFTREPRTISNRISASFYHDLKLRKRTYLETRLRWQRDYELNEIAYSRLRGKVGIEYNIKKCKLTPGIYTEAFYLMSYKDNMFNRIRVGLDFKYKLKKKRDISFNIVRQIALNDPPFNNSTIFSVNYGIGL